MLKAKSKALLDKENTTTKKKGEQNEETANPL
jgi:hypothetical protein